MTSPTPSHSSEAAPRCIEFWFDFGSNYSYLSALRIGALAQARHAEVQWRPMLLGAIFRSFGWATSPFVLQQEKGAYVWQDMARQAAKYGLPWVRPSQFPRGSVLPARLAVAARNEPWLPSFIREVFLQNFAADQEIDTREAVSAALLKYGQHPARWLEAAQTPETKDRLRADTETARALGIFGAPTFFVNGEMFWGNDRLDDAFDALGDAAAAPVQP